MKIRRLDSVNNFTGRAAAVQKIAKSFAKMGDIGEGASIACDFFGKAVVVPAVIMAVSSEPKDKKEYSAFKNPVGACIQLGIEAPLLAGGSYLVGKMANNGMFDIKGSDFSYNEVKKREEFVDVFEKNVMNADEQLDGFIEQVKKKGYSKQIREQFDDILTSFNGKEKDILKNSFKAFENTHKNQFHLKNRVCFLAALILTPIICAIENKIHPAIMDKIFKLQHLDGAPKKSSFVGKFINFDEFIALSKPTHIGGAQL